MFNVAKPHPRRNRDGTMRSPLPIVSDARRKKSSLPPLDQVFELLRLHGRPYSHVCLSIGAILNEYDVSYGVQNVSDRMAISNLWFECRRYRVSYCLSGVIGVNKSKRVVDHASLYFKSGQFDAKSQAQGSADESFSLYLKRVEVSQMKLSNVHCEVARNA